MNVTGTISRISQGARSTLTTVGSVLLAMVSLTAQAATVNLAWDANTEPTLAGYTLYYGTASKAYSYTCNASNVTHATVMNLTPGQTYYFVVTAYDVFGLESDPSSEISYTVPTELQTWRTKFFAAADLVNPTKEATVWGDSADPDRDGMTNYEEFLAGTNPNQSDLPNITNMEGTDEGAIKVDFTTVLNKSYRVERNSSFPNGTWVTIADYVTGNGSVLEITDQNAANLPQAVYRILVLP
jgi:hypothetical protein